jgi:hypothetical protein
VHGMADALTRAAEHEPEAPRRAAEEDVVVGVLVIGLDDVVVDVLGRQLGTDALEPHRLEREHHQRAGSVLGQRLIDSNGNLVVGFEAAGDAVARDELVREAARRVHARPGCNARARRGGELPRPSGSHMSCGGQILRHSRSSSRFLLVPSLLFTPVRRPVPSTVMVAPSSIPAGSSFPMSQYTTGRV